ncbi:MAG: PTS transporter subunit EIIB, partial [Fusobacteriaceae bacterium]
MRLISLASKNGEENVVTLYNYLPYKRDNEKVELEFITRSSNFKILNGDKEVEYLVLDQEIVDAGLIDRQVAARLLDIKVFKTKVSFIVDEIEGLSVKYLSYEDGENYSLVSLKSAESEDTDTKSQNKGNTPADGIIEDLVAGLGGIKNIIEVDNCISRLRIEVKDSSLVDQNLMKKSKPNGIIVPDKNNVHIVYGG